MARYQVILAYDGTDFYGFQRQSDSSKRRTVQEAVESALRHIGWSGERILFAGRTDTGVHASGQVIAFDLEWTHSLEALQSALNAGLPVEVAVTAVYRVGPDFHPRYAALSRGYQYRIFCQPWRDPLRERYAWRVWPPVELERLVRAATLLVGQHDFAAFGTPPRAGGTTVRRVLRATWQAQAPELIFYIEAEAFLYHMVRRLVRLQVQIGQGLVQPEALLDYLQAGQVQKVQGLAPPHGLTLVSVSYPANL